MKPPHALFLSDLDSIASFRVPLAADPSCCHSWLELNEKLPLVHEQSKMRRKLAHFRRRPSEGYIELSHQLRNQLRNLQKADIFSNAGP